MPDFSPASESPAPDEPARELFKPSPPEGARLRITFDVPEGVVRFEWFQATGRADEIMASGRLRPPRSSLFFWNALEWELEHQDRRETDRCQSVAASATALLKLQSGEAKAVITNAVPDITEAVKRGEITIAAATEVAKLTKAEQQELADAGPESLKAAAKKSKSETKTTKKAQPLAELRALFDSTEKPDEVAISVFCRWLLGVDSSTALSGAALWLEWSEQTKGPKQ